MGPKRCLACADAFLPSSRVPSQNYCSRPECQRERRTLWQKEKRRLDPDYRENQRQCQRRWQEKHTDYWQQYRARHPGYVERNRELQRERNAVRRGPPIAKIDSISTPTVLPSGTYYLRAFGSDGVAKMDACIVRIVLLRGASVAGVIANSPLDRRARRSLLP
jgi:hypothetical protein